MAVAKLRKVGGSAMLAVPPELLDTMSVSIGAIFDLEVANGSLIAKPAKPKYTLKQLLAEEKAAGIEPLSAADTEWTDAPAMGRETW